MKKITVETKNAGKVEVSVYESLEETIKEIGKDETLKLINRMVRVDAINLANRKESDLAKLNAARKADPAVEAAYRGLLKKYIK